MIGVELVLGRRPDARLAWHTGWSSRILFTLTLALTLAVPLQRAIIAGMFLSLAAFVAASASRTPLKRLVRDDDGWLVTDNVPDTLPADEPLLIRYTGPNFFADVPTLHDQLPSAAGPDTPGVLVLDLGVLEELSSTMLKELVKYQTRLASAGSGLVLVGVSERARRTLERTGVLDALGDANVLPADPHLLTGIEQGLDRGRHLLAEASRPSRREPNRPTEES